MGTQLTFKVITTLKLTFEPEIEQLLAFRQHICLLGDEVLEVGHRRGQADVLQRNLFSGPLNDDRDQFRRFRHFPEILKISPIFRKF